MPWKLIAERIFSGLFQKPLNYTEKMNIIRTGNYIIRYFFLIFRYLLSQKGGTGE